MRPSALLLGSAVLNVVLIAALIFDWRAGSDAADVSAGLPADVPGAASEAADLATSPARVFAWAKQLGVADELAYRFALAAARSTTDDAVPYEYWRAVPERTTTQRDAHYRSIQADRDRLLKSFGATAKEQPAFAEIFQPYADRFPFLSSDKQIAVQRVLFENADRASGVIEPGPGECPGNCDRLTAAIRGVLSEEEFAEYQHRESPLAVRLANTGFGFTEAEFRAVYDVVAPGLKEAVGAQARQGDQGRAIQAALPQIERVLGAARFREFKRAEDPIYRWLRLGANEFAVSLQAVDAAYELIKESENKAAAVLRAPPAGVDLAKVRADIYAGRDRELRAKLGADLFSYIAPRLECVFHAIVNRVSTGW